MTHVAAVESVTTTRAAWRFGPLLRILLGAAAISAVAGVAAVTLLDRLVGANDVPRLVPAPSVQAAVAAVPATASADTTVPDAETVFARREEVVEEAAPTF